MPTKNIDRIVKKGSFSQVDIEFLDGKNGGDGILTWVHFTSEDGTTEYVQLVPCNTPDKKPYMQAVSSKGGGKLR